MMNFTKHVSSKVTPQSEPIPGSNQVANSAGGYSFPVNDWTRLERFLILGSEGGSYYASERKLTKENASAVERCLKADGPRTVRVIAEISDAGRAPKNDPAIFALAMAMKLGDKYTRGLACAAVPKVCRIGTHLFQLAEYIEAFGGWGRGTKQAFSDWYNEKDPDDLAYQLVKYQQRNSWAHADILRLAHPMPATNIHDELFKWVVNRYRKEPRPVRFEQCPAILEAFEEAKTADSARLCQLIREHNLPREAIPTEKLNERLVWQALVEKMPPTAMIRNLAKMTQLGVLGLLKDETVRVCEALADEAKLKKARVHPIQMLTALLTYKQGHGDKGKLTWNPVGQVVDALDAGFYASFGAVEPSGAATLLAIDISGSMDGGVVAGVSGLTPRIAAAAMAMVTARVEKKHAMFGFCTNFRELNITPRMRLDEVVRYMQGLCMGGTDCSLPMRAAAQEGWVVDTFVVYTDSETWAGGIHPSQALQQYRRKLGRPAKLAVVGMVSNGFSIADPNDAGMLDVVGFDTETPQVISDFSRPALLS